MKKRNNYFIGLVFLVIALGSPIFIYAAEEASTMMYDEGVVNIGDTDADVREKMRRTQQPVDGQVDL
jgi:hypothetical protein